jgi:diaminopimelate epimerase
MKNARLSGGLDFMKMHGLGNDFVVIDSRGQSSVVTPGLARALGDRHRGVGFDQLAEIRDDRDADIALDFWNADGTQAQACGNATRCVAQHVMAETGAVAITIRTARGVLDARQESGGLVSVNMGTPQLDWDKIPLASAVDPQHLPLPGDPVAVGMGNPHCVFFVDDAAAADVAGRGAKIEHDQLFPQATNVEFAQVRGRDDIRMRVWERGTGITLACGSGACATAVAAHLRGLTDKRVNMQVDGGWLTLDWRDDGVWMTGPSAHVFSATVQPAFLEQVS